MSDTPRTDDTCTHDLSEQETACADGFCPICATAEIVRLKGEAQYGATFIQRAIDAERELVTARAELAELREELNDRRKFAYAVEQALDGLKGDYVEIILALRKDAAMKEGGK